jgi:PAS domain S-box-containing protein
MKKEIIKTPEELNAKPGIARRRINRLEKQGDEGKLEQSHYGSNFRNAMDICPLGIIVIGKEPQQNIEIIYANKAALDIHGFCTVDELKTMPPEDLIVPDSLTSVAGKPSSVVSRKLTPSNFEMVLHDKSGQPRNIEVRTDMVIWDGEFRRIQFYNDITESKKIEELLHHSQVLASLGEMTAGIAHEVGNPLASIVLYSEMSMKTEGISRQMKKDLKVIHGEAMRAGRLMKDLLAYSRKLTPKMQRLDISDVIKKVIELRQYQEKVRNIKMEEEFSSEPLYVKGDRAQLIQVFMNLLLNAEEAVYQLGGGTIKVNARVDNNWVKISVCDDGPGILKEHLHQIFLPFFTTKKVGEGTGLGLSLCYGIVTAHNGFIKANNNPTHGATFTVELPLTGSERQETLPL